MIADPTTFPAIGIVQCVVERMLTPEEARGFLNFDREVALGRLRVIRVSKKKYVVPPDAIREWSARGKLV